MDSKRYDEGNREGQPGKFNPEDTDYQHPAKTDKSREKVDIKESELGRETSQQPANEQMEPMAQIDDETREIQQSKVQKETGSEAQDEESGKGRDAAGYNNDQGQ